MSSLTGTSNVQPKLPGLRHTISIGVILGVMTSGLTEICFALGQLLMDELSKFLSSRQIPFPPVVAWDPKSASFFFIILVLVMLSLVYFAIVPTIIGGGMIGLILQRLACHGRLNNWAIVIVGALVGFGAGWATAVFFLPTVSVAAQWEPRGDPVLTGLIGSMGGLFHSWVLSQWLRKHIVSMAAIT